MGNPVAVFLVIGAFSLWPGSLRAGEKEAAALLRKIDGARLEHDQSQPGSPVIEADFTLTFATDNQLEPLKELKQLRTLMLGFTELTDRSVERLGELKNLRLLDLHGTSVTDAGLANLKGLVHLEVLELWGTKITDRGLEHLRGMQNLRVLNLADTAVTDAGMIQIRALSKIEYLDASGTKVGNSGLAKLDTLAALRVLRLDRTTVTYKGLRALKGLKNLQEPELDLSNVELGYLADGMIYTARQETHYRSYASRDQLYSNGDHVTYVGARLFRTGIGRKPADDQSVSEFEFPSHLVGIRSPLRWRVSHGACWTTDEGANRPYSSVRRFQIDELYMFRKGYRGGAEEYERKHPKYPHWLMEPATSAIRTGNEGEKPVFFDFLPTSANEGLLFVMAEGMLRVWKGVGKRVPGPLEFGKNTVEWNVQWTLEKDMEFPAIPEGPFQVFAGQDRWYLLTRSGKLYVTRSYKQGGPGVALLWKEDASPIKAMICDTASGRTFVFTAPEEDGNKAGRCVYFELADPPEPKPYKIKRSELNVPLPLKTVSEFTQVLVEDGRINRPVKK